MAKKIEIIGNSLRVTDTISSKIELSEPSPQIWYKEKDLQVGRIVFHDVDFPGRSIAEFEIINLADAVDSGDVAFTEETFRTFCTDNLAFSTAPVKFGGMALTDTPVIALDTADQYEKIVGAWQQQVDLNFFEVDDANDRIIYNGPDNITFAFNGSSDVKSSKTAIITYGAFKNGTLIPGAESPHTFGSANSIELMAITSYITLNKGDYVEIFAKSDTMNNSIEPQSLSITLTGTR